MNAPLSVIIVPVPVAPGDRGVFKKFDYRRQRAVRKDPPWPPKQSIPRWDKDELRRLVEQMREGHRQQTEAVLAAGRAMLAV
jgi:hypothetical protein